MSLRENHTPAASSRPSFRSQAQGAALQPTSQGGLEHFSAQSRLWGVLHERLGRAGVAQLLREGPRDALELQILHVAGFVESTGVDATAYLPWNAPLSWQDRTQPFYRALLGSIEERAQEQSAAEAGLLDGSGLWSASATDGLATSGGDAGGLDFALSAGLDAGFAGGFSDGAGLGALDGADSALSGGGWSGFSAGSFGESAGFGGGEALSLSRDALSEGPDLNMAFAQWFGTRLQAAGSGRALTAAEQDFLSEIHGRSFNDVRIHEGPGARQVSQAIAARAFTLGDDIFIGESGSLLDSAAGAELLAHEVTHVVQGDAGRLPGAPREGLSVSTPNQPHEQEASAIGRRARAVFATFEEKQAEPVAQAGWALDPSWDGDPIGAAVASHLVSVLPGARAAEADRVAAELREGMRGQARSSVAGQHVLVDVAEALGEDAEIVHGMRGALSGLSEQVDEGGLTELSQLAGAPDAGAMGAALELPGFTDMASGLLGAGSSDFAPLAGAGLGGLLFGGASDTGSAGADAGGADAGGAGAGGAVSRKASASAGQDEEQDASAVVDRATRSRGQGTSLPQDIRGRLEARLGVSLAGVRLHTDSRAADAADAVRAEAFTVGQDIYFNAGVYDPSSPAGVELIAHEATHAAQFLQGREGQATTTEGGVGVTKPGDTVEQEAEQVGAEIAGDLASGSSVDTGVDSSAGLDSASVDLGAGGTEAGADLAGASSGSEVSGGSDVSAGADAGDTVARSLLGSAGSMLSGVTAPLTRISAGGGGSNPLSLIQSLGPKIASSVPGLSQAMPLIESVIQNKGIPGLDQLGGDALGMLSKAVPGLEAAMPLIQSVVENKGLPSLKELGGPALNALGMAIPGVGAALPLVQGLLSGEGITSKNMTSALLGALGTAVPGLGLAMPMVESLLNNKDGAVSGLLSGASGLLGGASEMLTGAGGLLNGVGSMLGLASGQSSGAEGLLNSLTSAIPGGDLLQGFLDNKDLLGAATGGLTNLFGPLGAALPGLSTMLGGEGLMGAAGGLLGGLLGGGQGGEQGGGLMGAASGLLGGLLGGGQGGDNKSGTLGGGMGVGSLLQSVGLGGVGQMLPLLSGGAGVTDMLGDMGSAGALAKQVMGIPGITDLVNVVESGLANVAGEGKGLGRGSLAEGSDTVGWIMQAVPGLPELTGVLRGGLAEKMGNGSGSRGATQTSGSAGEEQVGSADRILGLDLTQSVGAGLAQVGGPTAGAAAQGGSPGGVGAIDTLDSALPGLSDFVQTIKSAATSAGGPLSMFGGQSSTGAGNGSVLGGPGGMGKQAAGAVNQGASALMGGISNKVGGLLGGLF